MVKEKLDFVHFSVLTRQRYSHLTTMTKNSQNARNEKADFRRLFKIVYLGVSNTKLLQGIAGSRL